MTTSIHSSENVLDEFTIMGGNDFEFTLNTLNVFGSEFSLSGATCTLVIALLGQPNIILETLTGSITLQNIVKYTLLGTTTDTWIDGKYIYQPIIVRSGKTYRPKQGSFMLVQQIG